MKRFKKAVALLLTVSLVAMSGVMAFADGEEVVTQGTLICEKTVHQHADTCYGTDGELTCQIEEHEHSDACYTVTDDNGGDVNSGSGDENTTPDTTEPEDPNTGDTSGAGDTGATEEPVIKLVVDSAEAETIQYDENGEALVEVNSGEKSIKCVSVDGEKVFDQSRTDGDGTAVVNTYVKKFADGKAHTVEVELGYKLVVKTRYVNADSTNGHYVPVEQGGTPDASEPTYYTLIVPAGDCEAKAVKLLPQPSADGKYPLRLLDHDSVRHTSGMDLSSAYCRNFALGTDDVNAWLANEGNSNDTLYYYVKTMPAKDCEVELRYNYNKICVFAMVYFEAANGGWVTEEYDNHDSELPPGYSAFHVQDTYVDETTPVSIDPTGAIFGEDVVFPEGTSKEDYKLLQANIQCDSNFTSAVYYKTWGQAYSDQGAYNVKYATGLTFDQTTGAVNGVLNNRLGNRNHYFYYYYQLLRPVSYDANGGSGTMAADKYTKEETVTVKENAFTRSGYRFTGWNTKADGTGTAYAAGEQFVRGEGDVVLYAQWSRTYLPIDPVDPDPVDPQPLPPDDPLEDPDDPVIGPLPLPDDDPLEDPGQQPLPEDEYLTDAPDEADAEAPADPDQPKTGDDAPLMGLTAMLLVSAGALGTICIRRRKTDK